ncbi:ISA3, partial [Symbiodinium natans]
MQMARLCLQLVCFLNWLLATGGIDSTNVSEFKRVPLDHHPIMRSMHRASSKWRTHTALQLAASSGGDLIETDVSKSSNSSKVDPTTRLDPSKCNIFSLWEKPKSQPEQPLFQRLVIEAWRRHSHGLCNEPFLITDDNVRQVIPDIPEEYFRMPYPAAKSDFIRYAVLYHHGGIYVDFDMLTVQDIDEIVEKVQHLDLVSYSDGYGRDHEKCQGFSSNFLGGRKGSSFHRAVWEAQKAAVMRHCDISEKKEERVCCFADETEQCHIPWGGLGEWISHKVFEAAHPDSTFCYSGNESFNPDRFEFVLEHKQKLEDAYAEFESSRVPQPLSRRLYHFFNALHGWEKHTCATLFNETTLVGHIFSRSFSSGHGTAPKEDASSHF